MSVLLAVRMAPILVLVFPSWLWFLALAAVARV